jgi:anthranilate synthase/aminodeoxychorismate synthase-like glutamine amidotransferase
MEDPNAMKILLLDNYDSFTYNLKALLERSVCGSEVMVLRNRDKALFKENFDVLVISPGPMTWKETGLLKELFETKILPEKIPVLGVCLGMQFLAGYYGHAVSAINNPVHGSQIFVRHDGDRLFNNIPAEFKAARYNSLGLYETIDSGLETIAYEAGSGAVMALKHKNLPFAGFQFHPESFLTMHGEEMIKNFMAAYV